MTSTVPPVLDRRRHPVRADLAARTYAGEVAADRFVDGTLWRVAADLVDLRPAPELTRSVDTQALFGETVTVYETRPDGWVWGQLATDGYVGYLPGAALAPAGSPATHRVAALRSFRYPQPDLKAPPLGLLSLGARVTVTGEAVTRGLAYALLDDGSAMVARHLVALDHRVPDWVATAEALVGTPYLWGGRSSLGLDCSALVQLAAAGGGIDLPRDSDMLAAEAGKPLPVDAFAPGAGLRGDLLFWKGHVAILLGPDDLVHANGFTMTVAVEPVAAALSRIAASEWGALTGWRRLG